MSKSKGLSKNLIHKRKFSLAPKSWSDLAIEISSTKYMLSTEKSVFDLIDRVVKTIIRQGVANGYYAQTEARLISSRMTTILLEQKAAFNSPVWFNVGVRKNPQTSACFIQSIEDSLEGIFKLAFSEALLFKFGSGTGTNFSSLRSKHERLSTNSSSAGLIGFLGIFDKIAGTIKSGGINRRAAKMVIVDIDHPEIFEFINWKKNEEKKALLLIENGYDSSYEGEAYSTISGQNSNNSVRVTDEFMRAVAKNSRWKLKFRNEQFEKDGSRPLRSSESRSSKLVKNLEFNVGASEIWKQLIEAAWFCGDPGIQFHDTINSWHTCPRAGTIQASNPCSEFMFIDDSACNLASINLVKFLKFSPEQGRIFDVCGFSETVQEIFIAQDSLIEFSSFPTDKIKQNTLVYRPLGIGYANLGALLMRMGLPYDSNEGRGWAAAITALLTGVGFLTSARLAKQFAPFPAYSKNRSDVLRIVRRHQRALTSIDWKCFPPQTKEQIMSTWNEAIEMIKKHGLRNAQISAIAPTGTIGLMMDCDTLGIEPDYSLIKYKLLAGGGGTRKIVNSSVRVALENLKYSASKVQEILNHLMLVGSLQNASALRKKHRKIFEVALPDQKGLGSISSMGHLRMVEAVQPFVSGAISKTINLPYSTTPQIIGKVYMEAWKRGLKSVSVYRHNSKKSQPLNSVDPNLSQAESCSVCS